MGSRPALGPMRWFPPLLLFVCGFSCTEWVLGLCTPPRLELAWLQKLEQPVDVVFLGSSHVLHQISPDVFDQERGVVGQSRSVNLGAPAMEVGEEMYLVQKILQLRPDVRWLVVEALPWDIGMQRETKNDFGARRVEWHQPGITYFMMQQILRSDLPWAEKKSLCWRHLQHGWRQSLHLARGVDAVRWLLQGPTAYYPEIKKPRTGYRPLRLETAGEKGQKNHAQFLQDPHQLFAARQRLPQIGLGEAPPPALRNMAEQVEAWAAGEGVKVLWWLHPNLGRTSGWHHLFADGTIQHLIAFDDPECYPDFYKVRWHFDLYHLNSAGSERLSRVLAREFLQQVQEP